MGLELTSIERSSNEQDHSNTSNIIAQSLDRQNVSVDNDILDESNMNSNTRYTSLLTFNIISIQFISIIHRGTNSTWIKLKTSKIFAFVVFTILAMSVGILTIYFTSSKLNKVCQLHFERTMESSLISSSRPRSVVVGDLNNDHQTDIVVANSLRNTIGILISKGDGTFAEQQTYVTGIESHPYSVVISDFNNDHYLDIAVANHDNNNIGIFLNNGNGTFTDYKLFLVGSSHPLFITISDLNKDGQIDIVVANNGTNNIGILFGYGNGSFQNQVTYDTGYDSFPHSLAVADFNNDSVLDIVVANYGTNNIGIFYGYDNGTFRSQQTYTTTINSNPSSIAVGDFNNDNKVDIVVANYGIGNIGIFYNHGNESFLPQRTYPVSKNSYPQHITVSDVNKDDKLDIVIIDSRNDHVHVLPGNGNGRFAPITTYDTISESNPWWLALGDFNNNNQSDIVVVNYGINNVLVLLDYSIKPSARQDILYPGKPNGVTSVAISDFNNDHISDIVSDNGDILILTGLGNGTFSKGTPYSTGYNSISQYVCVGDVNNDNRVDIVVADTGTNSADVLLGYGDGTFGNVTNYSTGIGSQPFWVALGDFNHDNALDIVSANKGTNSIGILLGNGNGTFDTVVIYPTGTDSHPYSVAVGVINNGNHLDIAVSISYRIIIFLGQGNGTFIMSDTFCLTNSFFSVSITLADLNSDNHLDIVVANTYTDNVGVFLGYGDGSFAPQTPYFTGSTSSPYYVMVADFNNDNITDIAATAFGINQIVIFYGSGNGGFELIRRYSTGLGSEPYGISAVDLNNDKHLEIVVALRGNGDIAELTEYYAAEFVNQTEYATGSAPQPFSVSVGDFNNDNQSDIVVAYSGTDNLDILLGANNGTFHTEMIYPVGTHYQPQYVIACDVNRDSYLDIINVNSKNNSISVIMGYGNGSFEEELIYLTGDGSLPYAVTCSDLNNDTHLDLVIANHGTDCIGIFFGFNYTSFQSQVTYSSDYSQRPWAIIVNDFNNDTFPDIATVFFGNNSLGILLGYGNGSFTNMMIYSTGVGSQPLGIDVGDFNNDSLLDIVVSNWYTCNVGVLLGYGNGSFATIMTYSTGDWSYPGAVAVGDLNSDGQLDLVVANSYSNNVGVLLGYGNGSFSIVQTYSTGQDSGPYSVTVGDFDNDGRLDIAVANYGIGNVGVFLNYGNGTFKNQTTLFTGSSVSRPYWVTVSDFNSDNQLDIAVANYNVNNIGIFLGHGNGSFRDVTTYSTGYGSSPTCIGVDDFNNDSILDIAVTNYGSNNIVVLFGFGDGTFLLGKPYSTGTASQPYGLAFGDFNKDGRSDVAVVNNAANNIGVFLGYDSEPFGSMKTSDAGSQPHSVTTGDLNSDGRLDIVVANYGTDNVGILLGRNNRVFDTMMTYPTGKGSAPYAVGVSDFNNDTYLDIVVSNSQTDNIAILLGYGNGTFADGMVYSTGTRSRPYGIAISDFNNDSVLDIVVANSGTSNIYVLYGYGNGTFGNDTSYSLGYGYEPYSIAVKDLNGDGWIDMVIACYGTDHVEILMKMC